MSAAKALLAAGGQIERDDRLPARRVDVRARALDVRVGERGRAAEREPAVGRAVQGAHGARHPAARAARASATDFVVAAPRPASAPPVTAASRGAGVPRGPSTLRSQS